jgi:hypothetical protein
MSNNSKLVFVYSIPRPTATGLSDWVNDTSGKKLQKTKIGRAEDRIMALYNPKVGGLANYITYTPWVDPSTGLTKTDEKGNPLMLQEYLEQKWNLPKGFLHNRPTPKNYKGDGNDLSFYQTYVWRLKDGVTVFDLSTMEGELGYYVLLASSRVANSEREWREHKWPKATHYIALENESEDLKYTKTQLRSKTYAILHDPKITEDTKRKFVSLLDLEPTNKSLTPQQVHNALFSFIERSDFNPGSNIEKITNLFNLLQTSDGRAKFDASYILQQA